MSSDTVETNSPGKSAQEHLEWCIERAMEAFDAKDEMGAITSFISDVGKHDGTKHILNLGAMNLAILKEGAAKGRDGFEKAMRDYAI